MEHLDYCTHYQFPPDRDILTRPNFDVNIRLFHSNPEYRTLVLLICDYICRCASTSKEGYKPPHGWSGANAGIPFNIISFSFCGTTQTWINPVITRYSKETKMVRSNCGSLTLPQPKSIRRSLSIDVDYYDLQGHQHLWTDIPPIPGFTIQHEIEHTQGILI